MKNVLASSLEWAGRTHGAFDPTVAPLLDLWNIPSGPHPPPQAEEINLCLTGIGWRRVHLDRSAPWALNLDGTQLDLGAIAKGYAIDRAVNALRNMGVFDFIVEAGGDLFVSGSKGGEPWRVAIRHPRDAGAFLRIVLPREGALVTSGDYERAYEWEGQRIHHILDPRTGFPSVGCQSVTVWASTAMDADALATAAFVMGPEEGLSFLDGLHEVEGLIVDASGHVFETTGFDVSVPKVLNR